MRQSDLSRESHLTWPSRWSKRTWWFHWDSGGSRPWPQFWHGPSALRPAGALRPSVILLSRPAHPGHSLHSAQSVPRPCGGYNCWQGVAGGSSSAPAGRLQPVRVSSLLSVQLLPAWSYANLAANRGPSIVIRVPATPGDRDQR